MTENNCLGMMPRWLPNGRVLQEGANVLPRVVYNNVIYIYIHTAIQAAQAAHELQSENVILPCMLKDY